MRAYHHIPVESSDIHKTAVVMPSGLFKFTCMPFCLRNADQTFQWFIDQVLSGLTCSYTYLDDILVASKDMDEHLSHLHQVLTHLQDYGIQLNAQVCFWYCLPKVPGPLHGPARHTTPPLQSSSDPGVPPALYPEWVAPVYKQLCLHEIAESLQQVKHKGGSCSPIRTLRMGDATGDCGIFATCNQFQGFWLVNMICPYMVRYMLFGFTRCKDSAISCTSDSWFTFL